MAAAVASRAVFWSIPPLIYSDKKYREFLKAFKRRMTSAQTKQKMRRSHEILSKIVVSEEETQQSSFLFYFENS